MRILPVIDLLNGAVVRGVAGNRSEYRPIESRLVANAEPLAVARAFRSELGLNTLYVADLDAILRGEPGWDLYRQLCGDGFDLWIDAGLRKQTVALQVLAAGAAAVIVGLETWPGPEQLAELCSRIGSERVIFSLDLRAGQALGEGAEWRAEAAEIAAQAVGAGIGRMIVLDLAHVGVDGGVATLDLCRRLRERHSDLELITGGGIRHLEDLIALRRAGIDGVLIASALHDARVTRDDLDRLNRESPTANRAPRAFGLGGMPARVL